jgi:CheY-like chemotaxis protein
MGAAVKILICSESEILRGAVSLALEAAGHQVFARADPFALVPLVSGSGALLVDAARGKQAVALMREEGFSGRSLLLSDSSEEELERQTEEFGTDGALAPSPPGDLARRFAAAISSRRRRVLIVDDSEIVARLLREELEAKGFEIHYAPDAEKATSIILKRHTRPDLILLDINMPKVDGAQFCRFVKKNDMFRSIRVIFCSGESREKIAALAVECKADGYIHKDQFLGRWIVDNTE